MVTNFFISFGPLSADSAPLMTDLIHSVDTFTHFHSLSLNILIAYSLKIDLHLITHICILLFSATISPVIGSDPDSGGNCHNSDRLFGRLCVYQDRGKKCSTDQSWNAIR